METRACKTCGQEKSIEQFYITKRQPPVRRSLHCKKCESARANERGKVRWRMGVLNPTTEKPCAYCGRIFSGPKLTRYCEPECRYAGRLVFRQCQQCGRKYRVNEQGGNKYCGNKCRCVARRRKDKDRVCIGCSKTFEISGRNFKQRYCTALCAHAHHVKQRYASGIYQKPVNRNCIQCGEVFQVTRKQPGQVYCNKRCVDLGKHGQRPIEKTTKESFACLICGKIRYRTPHQRSRKKFCSRVCLGIRNVQKAATISPTSIEVDAYRALDELGIAYKPQHRLGSFVIDALIEDRKIAVEVQGDYWHCNPTKYPNGPQDEKQRRGVEKDKRRFEWLKSKGYQVIELWESDIRSVGAKALLEKALSI